jgi:DNA polymerase-3 subunit delta
MDRLKEHQKAIAPDAFMELQKKTGNNMRQIFDELDKLVTFVGERKRIEKNDVEELVSRTSSDRIFDLTNAIGQRSLPLALANLRSILEKGDHPLLIHNMLTRQIRFLLQAKLMLENGDLDPKVAQMSYDVFQKREHKKVQSELGDKLPDSKSLNLLKQHPFPIHLTLQQTKNFTVQELIAAMERLLEADVQLKSSRLTPELVVEMLVMDLINA